MLGRLLDTGITGVGTDHVFLAVQQLIHLHGGHVDRRAHHAVHHADVGLHAQVVMVALHGLMHFRVALAVLVFGRAGALISMASTMVPWRNDRSR